MSTISSRRFFIVVVLLVTAVAGSLVRSLSAPQSTPYDVGTLLMVMWVPVVGHVVGFLARKLRPKALAPLSFSSAMPYVPQIVVALELRSAHDLDLPKREQDGRIHCLFIAGTEGFSVRVSLLAIPMASGALGAEAQFLVPSAALPKFPIGCTFRLMQGSSAIGTGQVVALSSSV
jgi:hypothetical protein